MLKGFVEGLKKVDQNVYVTVMHLSIFTGLLFIPLFMWIARKQDSNFIEKSGKNILNFVLTMLLFGFATYCLMYVIIGFVIAPILVIFETVYIIKAAIKASNGEVYQYPLTIRFIK